MRTVWILILVYSTIGFESEWEDDEQEKTLTISKIDTNDYSLPKHAQYVIHDVNPGEGFNLRRDVYMRVANTIRLLIENGHNAVMVLPPFGRLHHWRRGDVGLPWREFFDVESLNRFVPVMEFEDFLKEEGKNVEKVLYLQHYAEGWQGEYVHKFDERPCTTHAYAQKDGQWRGWFFGFDDVVGKEMHCISFQGDSMTLAGMIGANFSRTRSLMIDRAETVLHHEYGDRFYWQARRSMRYSEKLTRIADEFIKTHFGANDVELASDWRLEKPSRTTKGAAFIGVHWRRRDFVHARGDQIPSIRGAAEIINKLSQKLSLKDVYLATDAPVYEIEELAKYANFKIHRYENEKLSDGQLAIIDQIICANSRHFIGSYESTFSFRIQEDREIRGFPKSSTFNRMCADGEKDCEQPAKWKIVY